MPSTMVDATFPSQEAKDDGMVTTNLSCEDGEVEVAPAPALVSPCKSIEQQQQQAVEDSYLDDDDGSSDDDDDDSSEEDSDSDEEYDSDDDSCSDSYSEEEEEEEHLVFTIDQPSARNDSESGDTVSETSVASEALDILFGRADDKKQDVAETTVQATTAHAEEPTSTLEEVSITAPEATTTTPAAPDEARMDILFGRANFNQPNNKTVAKPTMEETKVEVEAPTTATAPVCVTPSSSDCLTSPPRQTNRVSMTASVFASNKTTSSSSSSRRVPAPSETGLSELSKQLRVLQANNRHLQSEMERCQRQLKIMAESKGVSVSELKASLETACAKEAHSELQSLVNSLQAQLEALQMSSSHKVGGSPSKDNNNGPEVSRATVLEHESLKQQIATLQLQVGEHEEMESQLKEETQDLYAKVEQLETTNLTLATNLSHQATLLSQEQEKSAPLQAEVYALKEERALLKDLQAKRMAKIATLGAEVAQITAERDALQERQTKRMSAFLQHTFAARNHDVSPYASPPPSPGGRRGSVQASCSPPPPSPGRRRPMLQRTFSDPAMHEMKSAAADARATIPRSYVASILPRYSSTYKQWTYDVDDDSHRSNLYVKQSAKNMELEVLCRHQQQTLEELKQSLNKEKTQWDKLEAERGAANAKHAIAEEQVRSLKLMSKLDKTQNESLRSQLKLREDEYTLKKDQLQSRLQVHQERIHDLEGQLSSLYVAYELLEQDRSIEQSQHAELRTRLIDADSKVAHHMFSSTTPGVRVDNDARLAVQFSQMQLDASEVSLLASSSFDGTSERADEVDDATPVARSSNTTGGTRRRRPGLLAASPRRKSGSRRNLFARGSSTLPPVPPMSASRRGSDSSSLRIIEAPSSPDRGSSTVPSSSASLAPSPRRSRRNLFSRSNSASKLGGLPPVPSMAASHRGSANLPPPSPARRSSTGTTASSSASVTFNGPPPPGTTILKGYLLQQQPGKKKLLGRSRQGEWKRKYMVLKRGEGLTCAGTYCLWFGDMAQGKVRGVIPNMIRGITTITFDENGKDIMEEELGAKAHSFEIHINPRDPNAPVHHLAAFSAHELTQWKTILSEALLVDYNCMTEAEQHRAEVQMTAAMNRNYRAA